MSIRLPHFHTWCAAALLLCNTAANAALQPSVSADV